MISVLVHLGYGFVRASLSYPFRIGKGKARFLASYGVEGLVPATAIARELSVGFERCLGCGLCELALARPEALRELACSLWRSPETWPGLDELLGELSSLDLSEAEARCPAEVPLGGLVMELRGALGRGRAAEWGATPSATSESDHSTIEE